MLVAAALGLVVLPATGVAQAQSDATAPSSLTAQIDDDGYIKLSWDAPTQDHASVTGYRVLRRLAGTDLAEHKDDIKPTNTSYVDKSATRPGVTHTYQVQARRDTVLSSGSDEASATVPQSCVGVSFNTAPADVPVAAVPIVVESTAADYFVLFVRPDLNKKDVEFPISMTLGTDGETTLTDRLSALPVAHYRVEKYPVDDPADVDGDCTSDIAEFASIGSQNPLNRAPEIDIADGAVAIPDHATFEQLSYHGEEVLNDSHLSDLEYVKFFIYHLDTDRPAVYFMNTVTYRAHFFFSEEVEFPVSGSLKGEIIYHPDVVAPNGKLGAYRFQFQQWYNRPFEQVQRAYEVMAANMPLLDHDLYFFLWGERALSLYETERDLYDNSRVEILSEEDISPDIAFTALNFGEGYGRLRVMSLDERPNPRDIVIYESLPNDLPRVAGIITTVPQTPLSHVNLRAIQDRVPNSFIRGALEVEEIDDLTDSYVHYRVTQDGYEISAATKAQVDAHYADSRPSVTQTPERDLTVTQITALSDVEFDDWTAFGVKAANVAVLGTLEFPVGTVPDGFAVPFYFYDEFMKANDLYTDVEEMLADAEFQTDYDTQEDMLKDLRRAIKDATTPDWIITALGDMHDTFPDDTSLRYRSSTNNEDLPGFTGAGLYDSKTQDPDETEEDGIDKSIKGVWASLWNFGAFIERDFHRIDHSTTAMGVLVHPNYSDELANGVAISYDPIGDRADFYYVNTQLGEDLVTNPEALSVPEEILLRPDGSYQVLVASNQTAPRDSC